MDRILDEIKQKDPIHAAILKPLVWPDTVAIGYTAAMLTPPFLSIIVMTVNDAGICDLHVFSTGPGPIPRDSEERITAAKYILKAQHTPGLPADVVLVNRFYWAGELEKSPGLAVAAARTILHAAL